MLPVQPTLNCAMRAPPLIVYERNPYWGPELQRQFLHGATKIRGTGSLERAVRMIGEVPGSLFVMDSHAGVSECLRSVLGLRNSPQPFSTMLIGSNHINGLEWAARELGVDHYVPESIRGDELAGLCRRILSRTMPATEN